MNAGAPSEKRGAIEVPEDADPIIRLRKIVHCLRAPGGCPWDREQTHESLVPNLLEEAYETAAAIRCADDEHIVEELGDLLLQVVMHAEIASENDRYTLEDIAAVVADKLVRRHPHVFGKVDALDTAAVLEQWEKIKHREKGGGDPPHLENVGVGLPALMRAAKLQKRAAKEGFDWDRADQIVVKIQEEVAELEEAFETEDAPALREELGDLLFSIVNLARKLGLDSEDVLSAANDKFAARFTAMERQLKADGLTLDQANLEQMDAVWDRIKHEINP